MDSLKEKVLMPGSGSLPRLLETGRRAAREAGDAIMEIYCTGSFEVQIKADASPLTKADKTAHNIVVRHLQQTGIPVLSEEDSQVSYEERKNWDWYWLIDPLDGTREFIEKNGEFTVNIALMLDHHPVAGVIYAPATDTLYSGCRELGVTKERAGKQTRLSPAPVKSAFDELLHHTGEKVVASRSHLTPQTRSFIDQFKEPSLRYMGSSLKFMVLAEMEASIYPRFATTMEWDVAAGHAILNALNKGVYQEDLKTELVYNKPSLEVPAFVAF